MRSDFLLRTPRLARHFGLACAATGLVGAAIAQVPPGEAPSNATKKPARLPTQLNYTSPLQSYQAFKDQALQSWRQSNDRVGQIGGWKAYAKEAQAAEGNQPAEAAPSSDPHAGHHGGGQE